MRSLAPLVVIVASSLFSGCYRQAWLRAQEYGTRSIVVLPPLNESSEITASYELYSTITEPLANRGYYVYPVAIVDQFMKENGLPTAGEMHAVPLGKIHEIIGADAVLYPTVAAWHGPNLATIALAILTKTAPSTVEARYRLVDVKSGDVIWEHSEYVREDASLPKLGKRCNERALGQRIAPGPGHSSYRGPLLPLPDTSTP